MKLALSIAGALSPRKSRLGTHDRLPQPVLRIEPTAVLSYAGHMERVTVDLGKEWLSVADVCEYLDVSPHVVTRLLRSGDIVGVKIGREWRIARMDFESWLNQRRAASAGDW